MSEWISVKDKLPPKGLVVLASHGDNVFPAVRTNESEYWDKLDEINDHNAFGDYGYCEFETTAGVTHWMPLPEPPKETEK